MLNTKTRTFENKVKAKDNGERKQRKKSGNMDETVYVPSYQSPYDNFAEMNDKENELNKKIKEQATNLYVASTRRQPK